MSFDNIKMSPALEKYMTKEYRDLVERGPYGKQKTRSHRIRIPIVSIDKGNRTLCQGKPTTPCCSD